MKSEILEEIAPSFLELEKLGVFEIERESLSREAFGNGLVEGKVKDFFLRIVRDRSQLFISVAPPDKQIWFDIALLRRFLKLDSNKTADQAEFIVSHLDDIASIMAGERLAQLADFQKQQADDYLTELLRNQRSDR